MTADWSHLARARSLLFVPGDRPDRFAKAAGSGADGIVLDIEDAVAPPSKATARENIGRWLANGGAGVVRINDPSTQWYDDDVAMLAARPCAVMLAKVTAPGQVWELLGRLAPGSCVLPLIETAAAALEARAICSVTGAVRAVFGNADLGRELGVDHADLAAMAAARSLVVLASAAAQLPPPIDGVTTALTDEKKVTIDSEHAAGLGFGGKLCLHPRQVPVVNAAFSPSAEDVRWAQDVLAAAGDGSVAALDGYVVGKPIVDRARRVLAQEARAAASHIDN
ncbi:HpcH/HpaI aldolase/citrate lyase family protein [Jiangella mangrovi]|uniref:Citrate lyase subunit beta/citryl-CoA lyase n=1 Tax=Jiangella mangrovi TaxID=1524084 RepID=A0A7W9GXW6_9ACTN|nr:CoA ester lyase [Jiangella mangrovi]MBB5791676.1 citrate lyase subunit beta/citryl-CoA lyase [Jiangella mangrovi]